MTLGAADPDGRYLPIEEHGIIGDLRTVALVGSNGTIDWFCPARFDAPALFASILDADKGGFFSIHCTAGIRPKQLYLPDSNILLTRFLGHHAVGEVIDFMAPQTTPQRKVRDLLVRRVLSVRGRASFHLRCYPAFDYGRADHELELLPGIGVAFRSALGRFVLRCGVPLEIKKGPTGRLGVEAVFELEEAQGADFELEWEGELRPMREGGPQEHFEHTADFWRRWIGQSHYKGRWREMVNRSALALKLLVHHPTGALVAAATTSLPEEIGGVRNWDYRYAWLRDASFTIHAPMKLGFQEEASAFMDWLQKRCDEACTERDVMIMYAVDGTPHIPEQELSHFEGYRGSRPVRIGNNAVGQRQIDVYGELMDSVFLYNRDSPISYDLWQGLKKRLAWLAKHWQEPDEGIWEVRGPRQRFTYSALMTWVAFDRAQKLARDRGLPAPVNEWRDLAAAAYEFVQNECWDSKIGAYVMHPGSKLLDASVLVMPIVRFSGPTDPRFLMTLERINEQLVADSLVHRYTASGHDGLTGAEGTYVDALTRAGKVDEARMVFEKMLTYANHLGLYAEEIGSAGEALGNFPQAFTHLALISAAVNLDDALNKR